MKIPEEIQIAGRHIKIIIDPKLADNNDNLGESKFKTNEIILQPNTEHYRLASDNVNITFLHEIIHFILDILAYQHLNKNESFINKISELFYQVIKQIEGEK